LNVLKLASSDYGMVYLEPVVKEGQRVREGDVIVRILSRETTGNLEETEAAVAKEKANLELMKRGGRPEEIEQAKEEVKKAESEYQTSTEELQRFRELFNKKLISKEEMDKKESENAVLNSELGIAKNKLKILQKGASEEEIRVSEAEIARLEAKVKLYKDQVAASDLKSPISGIVTHLRPAENLLKIANYDTMRVLIPVSEKDMDIVSLGQKVKAKVRSFPFKTFSGLVTRISHQGEKYNNKEVFTVTSKIDNSDLLLKPGMTGQAKIYCGKRSIAYLLLRRIVGWIRVEVWSWF